jgi:hypothetical protein
LNDRPLRIKSRVLHFGPIPPAAGPSRLHYLDVNGRAALQSADDEFAATLEILGALANAMPRMREPLIEDDHLVRIAIQREKRAEWENFANALDRSVIEAVEPHVRASQSAAVAALNFLEDHELAESAHRAIHRAAFVRRGLFGCPITFGDNDLWTDCPMRISHWRLGMSVGMTTEFVCSVCECPVEDCDEHVMGETYDKLAITADDGGCSICDATDCNHVVGTAYPTKAYGVGRIADVHEVSMVARPRYPQARIVGRTLNYLDLDENPRLRWAAENGQLNCDHCLGPCDGFSGMESEAP